MFLKCHSCASKFRVSAEAIGDGREVRCAKCKNEWFAYAHDLLDEVEDLSASENVQVDTSPTDISQSEEENTAKSLAESEHSFISGADFSHDATDDDGFGDEPELSASEEDEKIDDISQEKKFTEEDLTISTETLEARDVDDEAAEENLTEAPNKKNVADNFAPIPGLAPVFVPVLTINNNENKVGDYDFAGGNNVENNISFGSERALPEEGSARERRRYWHFSAALAASFILFFATSLFTWADEFRKEFPAMSSFYNYWGITNSEGVKLANIKMLHTPLGSTNRYNISGAVINTASEMRSIPSLRIVLVNKNGKVLQSWPFPQRAGSIAPGEKLEFNTGKIDSHFVNSEYAFLVDVGNELELWRRKP